MGNIGNRNYKSTPSHDAMTVWLNAHYVDILTKLLAADFPGETLTGLTINLESSLDGYPLLFPDALVSGRLIGSFGMTRSLVMVCEVKPYMDSLGATIRQVKLYSKRLHKMRVSEIIYSLLVTDTTEHDTILQQQGIYVVHPSKFGYKSLPGGWDRHELLDVIRNGAEGAARDRMGYRLVLHWISIGDENRRRVESGRPTKGLPEDEALALLKMWITVHFPENPDPDKWVAETMAKVRKTIRERRLENPTFEITSTAARRVLPEAEV